MITRWLVKIVVVVGLVGFVLIEAGSPLLLRAQLDGVAHDVADEASGSYFQSRNQDQARAAAQQEADNKHAFLVAYSLDPQSGVVRVTVEKEAQSALLKKVKRLRSWYDVKISATSQKRGSQ